MTEKPTPEMLEAVYSQLNSHDLATVQQREHEFANKNRQTLRDAAARVQELGLFPTMRVAFDSSGDQYDIKDYPLMLIAPDPETKNISVLMDPSGELHLAHSLSPWEAPGEQRQVVDFTVFERGVASNEHYMNFTKMAIRKLMGIVTKANTPPTPQSVS